MEWSIMAEVAFSVVVSAALFAWGVFVLKGNERSFRLLSGGRDFLALDPDEEVFRKTARESGVSIFLVAVWILCVTASDVVPRLDGVSAAAASIRAACFVVEAVSVTILIAIVIVQLLRYRRLLSKRR